jgi:hypothetical protein
VINVGDSSDDMELEDEGLVFECSVVERHRKNRDTDAGSRCVCGIETPEVQGRELE